MQRQTNAQVLYCHQVYKNRNIHNSTGQLMADNAPKILLIYSCLENIYKEMNVLLDLGDEPITYSLLKNKSTSIILSV